MHRLGTPRMRLARGVWYTTNSQSAISNTHARHDPPRPVNVYQSSPMPCRAMLRWARHRAAAVVRGSARPCSLIHARWFVPRQAEALCCGALLQEFIAAMPELERHCGFARDNIPQVDRRLLSGRLALHCAALHRCNVPCIALHRIELHCIALHRVAVTCLCRSARLGSD